MTSHDPTISDVLEGWERLDADVVRAGPTDRVMDTIDVLGQSWTDYTFDQIDSLSTVVSGMEEWGTLPEIIAGWLISVLYREE